nr:inactive protein kinase [Tanacetum cinerariifolium]
MSKLMHVWGLINERGKLAEELESDAIYECKLEIGFGKRWSTGSGDGGGGGSGDADNRVDDREKVLRILEGNFLVEKLDYHQEQSIIIFLKPNLESAESSK